MSRLYYNASVLGSAFMMRSWYCGVPCGVVMLCVYGRLLGVN